MHGLSGRILIRPSLKVTCLRSNGRAPKSGKLKSFPEMDKAGWFTLPEAKQKILEAQIPLIEGNWKPGSPNEFK